MENIENYNEMLNAEADHWDEFERDFIENKKIIPWWLDLQRASKVAPNTNEGLDPYKENLVRGKYKQKILENCNSGDKVLDIGCGSGWLSLELARKGCQVTAIDISPYRIALAKAYLAKIQKTETLLGSINYICGDIKEVELASPLDVIVAWDSLHHFPSLDELFERLKQFLKPEGKIVCYDHLGSKFIENLGKIRRYFVEEKVSAFEDVSQDEIHEFINKHFQIEEKRYRISAPFRLLAFALFRYDFFNFLIRPAVAMDEIICNKLKFLGKEFIFIKAKNK